MNKINNENRSILVHVPNLVTTFRVILIPVFLVLLINSAYTEALMIFILASFSDAVDGIISRKIGACTRLGKFLDPMADKLLLVSAFLALTLMGKLPAWLTVIVISRDVILFIGWLGIYVITGKNTIKPTVISKINTVLQMMTIIMVIGRLGSTSIIFTATAIATGISGIHYMIKAVIEVSYKNGNND